MGVKFDRKCPKWRHEKSRRFAFFLVGFLTFWSENCPIGIYRKTGPTKSTVLGPGPPPWRKVEIYRFLTIFCVFGVFNRAGKSVSKIGIYALPPSKSEFYGQFIDFLIIRDPICQHIMFELYVYFCFFGPQQELWRVNLNEFFWILISFVLCVLLGLVLFLIVRKKSKQKTDRRPPKRGLYRRSRRQ
jgi:ABC-type sugar transport system permease subunit